MLVGLCPGVNFLDLLMNWYKEHKFAIRGNIPRMEDPDIRDPYHRRKIDDGQGWNLTRPANEDTHSDPVGMGSGMGSRFRKDSPKDFSLTSDDYDPQHETDIPESSHTLMERYDDHKGPDATELITFYDEDSPLLVDKLNNKKREPVGPHNQHRKFQPIETVRRRLR